VSTDDRAASAAVPYAQLLSLAVHEFRTPASVVGGYLRMLERDEDPPLSDRQRKMVEEASKSCARLVTLVAELSEISKLDAGTAAYKSEPFDLFEEAARVAADVQDGTGREVRLSVRGDTSGARITGDPTRMRAALAAVFRAVLREQPSACTVVAERRRVTRNQDISALVVVARETDLARASGGARVPLDEKRGGMGLALPIARRVIEYHGGHIWSPAAADGADEAAARSVMVVSLPLSGAAVRRENTRSE
jgi:signal transduction histidine kinase